MNRLKQSQLADR